MFEYKLHLELIKKIIPPISNSLLPELTLSTTTKSMMHGPILTSAIFSNYLSRNKYDYTKWRGSIGGCGITHRRVTGRRLLLTQKTPLYMIEHDCTYCEMEAS